MNEFTVADIEDFLETYGHKHTPKGVAQEIAFWRKNKGDPFDERFKDNPNFIPEQHCIARQIEVERKKDVNIIKQCWDIMAEWGSRLLTNVHTSRGNVHDLKRAIQLHDARLHAIRQYGLVPVETTVQALQLYAEGLHDEYNHLPDLTSYENRYVTSTSVKVCDNYRTGLRHLITNYNTSVTAEVRDQLKKLVPDFHVNEGEKTSRVVLKWLKHFKINELVTERSERMNPQTGEVKSSSVFEQTFAQFSDAFNPLTASVWQVLSWNLPDFLTMSFGPNWTSCMSPDKNGIRHFDKSSAGRTAEYHGCYCGGTLAYANDTVTMLLYTVTGKHDPNTPFWKEDKLTRQCFHYQHGQLLQGRDYPNDQSDANKSEDASEYATNRQYVQSILGGQWTEPKFEGAYHFKVTSGGCQYPDYHHYKNCNTSITLDCSTPQLMKIGARKVCPNCGAYNDYSDYICCDDCISNVRCCECGCNISEDEAYLVDGDTYCIDCVVACYRCSDYVQHINSIEWNEHEYCCTQCAINDGANTCENCNELIEPNNVIYIDNYTYCCEDCACNDGWFWDDENEEWRK